MNSSFSDRLEGKTPEPNPLEIIGLTPAILRLGLSDDDLYKYCQQSANSLLAKVHPDKIGRETEVARRFSEAIDLLKKREIFDKALAQFRQWDVYIRANERILMAQKEELERRLRIAEENGVKENRFSQWTKNYLVGQAIRIKTIDVEALAVISLGISFVPVSAVPNEEGLAETKALYDQAAKAFFKEQYIGNVRGALKGNFLDTMTIGWLIERAKKSGFRAPLIRWDFDVAARELGFLKAASSRAPMLQETSLLDDLTSDRYQMIIDLIARSLGDMRVTNLLFVPEKIALPDDRFINGDAIDGNTLFVLGSVDLKTGLAFLKQMAVSTGGRTTSRRPTVSSEIITYIEPFIMPGRMIVSVMSAKPLKLQKKDAALQWQRITERRNVAMSQCPFFLSHIVL